MLRTVAHFEQAIGGCEDAMASHPLTLRFRSAKMERLFTQRRARRAARGTRVLLLMAFVQQILLMSIEEEAGEAALETGIEELADLEREEQLREDQPQYQPQIDVDGVSFSPDTNRAFADCFLTPQEIADDPQARAFATALFIAAGPATDVAARPSFAYGVATDGNTKHEGAVDYGLSPPCADGVQVSQRHLPPVFSATFRPFCAVFSPFFCGFRLPGAKTERTGEKWRKMGEIWGRNGRETTVAEWRWAQLRECQYPFRFTNTGGVGQPGMREPSRDTLTLKQLLERAQCPPLSPVRACAASAALIANPFAAACWVRR